MELRVKRAPRIDTEITVPGDKSISHRAAIIAALSNGVCTLRGFLPSKDCMHTVNAMRALGTDPIQKLVTPRMIAMCVTLPMLTIVSDFVGIFGGYIIAHFSLGLTTSQYWTAAYQALEYNDIVQGLLKPFVFAFVISLVGCFYGLRTTGGTQGVGRATTQAVVVASVEA